MRQGIQKEASNFVSPARVLKETDGHPQSRLTDNRDGTISTLTIAEDAGRPV